MHWVVADVRQQTDVNAMLDVVASRTSSSTSPASPLSRAAIRIRRWRTTSTCWAPYACFAALNERRAAGTFDPTTLIVGTGLQYGIHADERAAVDGRGRAAAAHVVRGQQDGAGGGSAAGAPRRGDRVVCTRSFNHSGAGQAAEFLLPSLVGRARALERDGGRSLSLGNDVVRDYLHVADVAEAYLALAERGRPGEVYNVCSGTGDRRSTVGRRCLASRRRVR